MNCAHDSERCVRPQAYKVSSNEMMMNVNVWQSLYLCGYLIVDAFVYAEQSETHKAYAMATECPGVTVDVIMFSLCAAAGTGVLLR
jgi:hypothetical protein